ncbi:MAG TPA: hypothetical protein VFS26_10170 [Solirubrobacterales bacterium]|nr:hypothetical protein [Solirubrobacterales bacterium]
MPSSPAILGPTTKAEREEDQRAAEAREEGRPGQRPCVVQDMRQET